MLLEIRKLNVFYNENWVIRDLDLNLEKGETAVILGESGAGKTTLGLSILGLTGGKCTGEIILKGRNLLSLREEEFRRVRGKEVAMVFQNVEDALHPLYMIVDQVAEAILVHNRENKQWAVDRAYSLLYSVGLDCQQARAYPHQLSGGQKQRALIAMAMANDPDVLILDEPTASLDAPTRAEITALLNKLRTNKVLMIITHDISMAARLESKIVVLYGGRIIESGPAMRVLANPQHPYTRALLRSYPTMSTTKDLQGIPGRMEWRRDGCSFYNRCTQRISTCLETTPKLQYVHKRMVACHRGGIVPVLQLKSVSKSFGIHTVINNVSLTLYHGDTLAIVGKSGSGKTTLAKVIMGLVKPDAGEIWVNNDLIIEWTLDFYHRVQLIFQNPKESFSYRLSILQTVKEPLDIENRLSEREKYERVRQVLSEVELPVDDAFLNKKIHQLSGGEAQRVAIARALVLEPQLLIADEPTSSLDASIQAKIIKLMMNLQEERGLSILLITHDIALARKVSDRIAVMLNGQIVEEGRTSDLISNPRHEYTKCLLESSVFFRESSLAEVLKAPETAIAALKI